MVRWTLVLVALVVVASPAASADTIDEVFALEVDADELIVKMQVTMTGADAQSMRVRIDEEHGDGDGTVEPGEVSRFNAEGTLRFDEDAPQCFEDFELVWIDDLTPTRLSLMSGRAEQATGPNSSTTPIRVTAAFTFLYPTVVSNMHRVQVEFDELDSFGESVGCYMDIWADGMWGDWEGMEGGSSQTWAGMDDADWEHLWEDYADSAAVVPSMEMQADPYDIDDPKTLLIQPRIGYTIDQASIQPARAGPLWDGKGLRADNDSEQLILMDELVTFTVRSGATPPTIQGTVMDVGAFVGLGVMGSGLILLFGAAATEYGRFHLWKLLFLIPGFTRLEKDEVLEHTKRDELYRFIKQNPGQSFSDLRRELSISNGTLVHHLRILEAQEYLKGVRDGFRTRFYVRGPKIVMDSYLTRTQVQLVEAISANPGLTQKELSHVLGLPRESISYHAKQLAAKGRLSIKQEGKWRRYWPPVATSTLGSPISPALVQS